jgi:hypothetical protein
VRKQSSRNRERPEHRPRISRFPKVGIPSARQGDHDLDRTVMIVAAMAAVILGGIAFTRIVNTLAALADAPVLAKRPLSKFLIAFFFIWGAEALLIGTVNILGAVLHTFAGNESSVYVTTAHVGFGLTAWTGGMVSCGLATLLVPLR